MNVNPSKALWSLYPSVPANPNFESSFSLNASLRFTSYVERDDNLVT